MRSLCCQNTVEAIYLADYQVQAAHGQQVRFYLIVELNAAYIDNTLRYSWGGVDRGRFDVKSRELTECSISSFQISVTYLTAALRFDIGCPIKTRYFLCLVLE